MEYVPLEIVKEIYNTLADVTDEFWSVAEDARRKAIILIEENKIEVDKPNGGN